MAKHPTGFDRVPAATLAPNALQFIGTRQVAANATQGRLRIPITRTERAEGLLLVLGVSPTLEDGTLFEGTGLFVVNSQAPDTAAFAQILGAGIPIAAGGPPLFWPLPAWITEVIIDGRGLDADGVAAAVRYFAQIYAVDRTVAQDIREGV